MAENLARLLRQTHITSDEDLLHAANAALKASKGDATAQHTRVVALLKLERFDDAVRAFDAAGDALKEKARLEYAYALYKSGALESAVEEALKGEQNDRGFQHLLAQVVYRLERFEEATRLYEHLSRPSPAARDEENDIRINNAAAHAQLQWKSLGEHTGKNRRKPSREDLESFESCYNAACGSIARGELGQAEILLRRATDLCQASDDLPDDAKWTEMLPISVQRAYVLSRLGRDEDAKQLLESIDITEIPDLSTRRLAKVNLLACAETPSNPYLAHRSFHSTEDLPKHDLLFKYQSSILRQNEYVLDLWALKYPGVARSTLASVSSSTSPTTSSAVNSLSVLNAAAHARNSTGKHGLKSILPLLEKRPNDIGLLLTIIQIYMAAHNHGSAIALVEQFLAKLQDSGESTDSDMRYTPGLVGTLVSLYRLQGRKTQIRAELAKAAEHWRSKARRGTDPTPHASLLKAAGVALLESKYSSDVQAASQIFTELYDHDPSDKASVAGLVASLSLTSPDKLEASHLDALPPASRLVAGIDAAALEEAGVARPPQALTLEAARSKKRPAEEAGEAAKKPKRIKPSRMPKDFDQNKKPDPERWLPMRDRSYYRPKGRKGKAKMAGLTQGGIVEDEKAKPQEQPSKQANAGGAGGGGGGGQSKGKKKKGKVGKR